MTVRDERIPQAIQEKLAEVLRRFRRVVLIKALTVTSAVFLASMLAAIALDRFFMLPFAARFLATATAIALTVLAAWTWGVRPWMQRPRDVDLAATVEVEHPELQERVSSTIEFVTKSGRAEFRGSEELIHAVSDQAIASTTAVDFAEVVSAERARKSTVAACFLAVLTIGIALLWWGDFQKLFHRFAVPWANVERVSTTLIDVGDPGDKIVAKGESVQITATVTPAAAEATLMLEVEKGRWAPIRMTRAESGAFSHRLADVTGSMRYTVRSGDGETRAYSITVIERPSVTRLSLRYDYPAYTKKPAKDEADSTGDVRAVVGTKVTVAVTASKRVEKARLELSGLGLGEVVVMTPSGPNRYEGTFAVSRSGQYVARLEDSYGFTNQDEEFRQIVADPDAAPVIRVTEPDRNIKLHRAATVGVHIEATDDYGLAELGIVYTINEGKEETQAVPMPSPGAAAATLVYPWALGQIALKPGDLITYRAKAVDNRPVRPNVSYSESRTILITAPEASVDADIRDKMLREAKKEMEQLKQELEAAKRPEDQLKAMSERPRASIEQAEKLKALAEQKLEAAKPVAEKLAETLKKDPLLEPLAPKAEEIAKQHVPEAAEATKKIDEQKPLADSQGEIEKARKDIDEALKKVNEMLADVKEMEKREAEERKLAEMADKEQKLAEQADKTQPDQAQKENDLARQQDDLKDQADKMMNDEMKKDAAEQALEDLKEMRKDLQDLINKEKDLKKETEDAKQDAPEMQKLAGEQKQLEDQAKDLADKMKEMTGALEQAQPEMADQSKKAQDKMQEAPKHMNEAEKDLKKGQPEPAKADEQKAIDAMEQADAEAGKLEQALAEAAKDEQGKPENGKPEDGKPEASSEMAKAMSDMKDAAQEMRGNKPEQGAKSMKQASNHLAQAAANMMKQSGKPHQSMDKKPEGVKGLPVKPVDLADLRKLKLTPEEWNRLPGEVKQQLLQSIKGNYPEEYRQLIRDYFSKLAQTGNKD